MTPMPSKVPAPRPHYQRWWQGIRREATRLLIDRHRDEFDDLVDELKTRRPIHH